MGSSIISTGLVRVIELNKSLSLHSISVSHSYTLTEFTTDLLIKQFESSGKDRMEFENMVIDYRVSDDKQYLTLTTLPDDAPIQVRIAHNTMHPLHKQYGSLKLRKVVYTDMLKQTNVTTTVSRIQCNIDYLEYDILKQTVPVGTLKLTAKELFKYIIGSGSLDRYYNKEGISRAFEVNAYLDCLRLKEGMPVFSCSEGVYKHQLKNYDHFEIVKSTSNDNVNNWINKMSMIYDKQLLCNNAVLDFWKINSMERLTLPDFKFISPLAFSKSPVKEIKITSPETIILPDDKIQDSRLYKNSYDQRIKITRTYDKSLEIPLLPFESNSLLQSFVVYSIWADTDDLKYFIKNAEFEV